MVEIGGLRELARMKKGVFDVLISEKGGLSCGSYPPIGIMEVPHPGKGGKSLGFRFLLNQNMIS